MNHLNDLSDDEFVPFLHSLGVETNNKSFEWLSNDSAYAGVLRWLYNNLDHSNALTAREEYRYLELQKQGTLLCPEDLESTIACIQQEYPGICLPGDYEAKEDVKLDVKMHNERLCMLEKQEAVIKDLMKENELTNEQLTVELAHLDAALRQCQEEEAAAGEECIALAQEVEDTTDGVVDVIAENLEEYVRCRDDKEAAKRFLIFSPLHTYTQSQALFRSHFDMHLSKIIGKGQSETTNDDLNNTLIEARILEERLSVAASSYIERKVGLSGVQAKLALATSSSNNVHPSQITSCLIEAKSALELLEQEESIAEQQVQNAVDRLVKSRTDTAINSATNAALNVRQQILSSLSQLVDLWQQALALDRLFYYSLRHELRTFQEVVEFGTQLRDYVVAEANAVASRIESMGEICAEHASGSQKLDASNPILRALCVILGARTLDASALVNVHNELRGSVEEMTGNVHDGIRKREDGMVEFSKSTKPLQEYVYSGCTKQANCQDQTVAALVHSLTQQMNRADARVTDASAMFTTVKNGGKQNLRKLWQWFLSDPARLITAMKAKNITL